MNEDPDRRVEFCEIFRQKSAEDDIFPEKVVCSYEASFTLNGHVSRHNAVYWASENPHVESEKDINTQVSPPGLGFVLLVS
jgi:hypothetical protein